MAYRLPGSTSRLALIVLLLAGIAVSAPACRRNPVPPVGQTGQSGNLALTNCTVINGTGAPPLENATIIIHGDKIASVSVDGKIPDDCRPLDLQGAWVLPGLINAHVHSAYDEAALREWLAAGVTTVRDLSPFTTRNFISARDSFNADPTCARIVAASPIIARPDGYGSYRIEGPTAARKAVADLTKKGVDLIKIAVEDDLAGRRWTLLSAEEVKAITDAAHARDLRVSAHISHVRNLEPAIAAGIDDIAHMVVEPMSEELVDRIIDGGIYWVPTLELWQGVSRMHQLDWDVKARDNLSLFYRAGGKVALGTDYRGYICSFDLGLPKTEIDLMRSAGMANLDIIVAATANAAHVCGMDDKLGTVAEGLIADLLVVAESPIEDLANLQKPLLVIHNGVIAVDHR